VQTSALFSTRSLLLRQLIFKRKKGSYRGAFQIVFFNQIALVQGTGAESSTPFPKTKRDSMSPFKVFFKVVV
jgi:hypothetical protein